MTEVQVVTTLLVIAILAAARGHFVISQMKKGKPGGGLFGGKDPGPKIHKH